MLASPAPGTPITGNGYSFAPDTGTLTISSDNGTTAWRDDSSIDKTAVTSLEVQSGVTTLLNRAFQDCSSLAGASLPDSVTSIGALAFWNCTGITSLTLSQTTAPTLVINPNSNKSRAFDNIPGLVIHVPKNASGYDIGDWRDYAGKIVHGAALSGLSISGGTLDPAFFPNKYDYSVTVPYSVASVTVTPTAHGTAGITVDGTPVLSGAASGPLSLTAGGTTTITILAKNSDTDKTAYTITVTREAGPPPSYHGSDDGGSDDSQDYYLRSLADKATGVKVTGGEIHENATLTVKPWTYHKTGDAGCDLLRATQKAGRVLSVYDVSLSRAFQGTVTISIPVEGRDGQTLTVAHCSGGKLILSNLKVSRGFVKVKADRLSPFAVLDGVYTLDELKAMDGPAVSGDNAETGGAKPNPHTGGSPNRAAGGRAGG